MPFLVQLAIGLTLMALSYVIMPRPKLDSGTSEPGKIQTPTATAGGPLPVMFGTVTLRTPNLLWEGESITETFR